jgi:hypothetical protein
MAVADVISQAPYPAGAVPDPDDVATIIARGYRFDDWESVFVQHRWADAFAWFRFTSAERESTTIVRLAHVASQLTPLSRPRTSARSRTTSA